MKNLRLLFCFLFLMPLLSTAQNQGLNDKLEYINRQFAAHNQYDLQFKLDIPNRCLKSKSQYYEAVYPAAKMDEVTLNKRGTDDYIVQFKCKGGSGCIERADRDNSKKESVSDYTVNLETNTSEANEVMDALNYIFSNLRALDNNNNSSNNNVSPSGIEDKLEYINVQFAKYNQYNLKFTYDSYNKVLYSKSTYYKVIYSKPERLNVELVGNEENNYIVKFKCTSGTCLERIDLEDNKTEMKEDYSVNLNSSTSIGNKTVQTLTELFELLSNTTSAPVKNPSVGGGNRQQLIDYINEQFSKYNEYKLKYTFDADKGVLYSKSTYFKVIYSNPAQVRAELSERGSNDYLVKIYCKSGSCLERIDLDDNTSEMKPDYSVNLTSNKAIADKMIETFNQLFEGLSGSNTNTNNNINNSSKEDIIDYLNTQFAKYNPYNTTFSYNAGKSLVTLTDKYYRVRFTNPSQVIVSLYKRGTDDYIVKYNCKNDSKCMEVTDFDTNDPIMKDSYSVNFTSNDALANKVTDEFIRLFKLVVSGD